MSEAFLWTSLPIERAIATGADRLHGGRAVQLLLQFMQPTRLCVIGIREDLFGQSGTDPGSWERF